MVGARSAGDLAELARALTTLRGVSKHEAPADGCERQIRLRRTDPSLGPLPRSGQVAATARDLRARGRDCGFLVQRQLSRIRRSLPPELRGRTAFQTPD